MSELEDQLARYRKAILDKDRAAQLRLLNTYRTAMERLAPLIELVQFDINSMDEPTPVRIFQLERYRILERQLREEMDRLAQETGTLVRGGQADVIQIGFDAARDIAAASAEDPAVIAGSFAGVPRDAVLDLVGMLEPDSPTGQLLASFGEVATKAIRDALTSGVILGKNPRVVAQAVRHATGMQASRALLISRTEMLRSYRTAKLQRYAANADILDGWKWVSAKQRRTCAACLAMDGETFPLSVQFFPAHPACRCTARPVLNDKYAAKRAPLETGDQWLRRQDADTQDAILGKQGGQAFRDGEVELRDFVRTDKDPKWGESKRDGGIAWARKQAERRAVNTITSMPTDPYENAIASLPDRNAAKSGANYQTRTDFAAAAWDAIPDGRTLGERSTYNGKEVVTEKSLLRNAVEWYTRPHGDRGYHTIRMRLELAAAGLRMTGTGANEAWAIARAIHLSPPMATPLYRGSFSRSKSKPERLGSVGDTIRLPGTASFTVDKRVADAFRQGTEIGGAEHDPKLPNHETTIVVMPGAKGFRVDSLSIWDQAEVISSGEFEIVSVEVQEGKRKNGKTYEHVTYTVQQKTYWEPPEDPPGRFQ